MGMTPDQFLEIFVEGNYEDYAENPECVRRAFNAALSASHLADHYYAFYKQNEPAKIAGFKTLGDFIEHIAHATDAAFRDIRSISNAYKHLYTSTDPNAARYSTISSAGSIESIDFWEAEGDVASVGNRVGCDQCGKPFFAPGLPHLYNTHWRDRQPAASSVLFRLSKNSL